MNDTPGLFDELDCFEPTTIRPATPERFTALDRLAEFDDRGGKAACPVFAASWRPAKLCP